MGASSKGPFPTCSACRRRRRRTVRGGRRAVRALGLHLCHTGSRRVQRRRDRVAASDARCHRVGRFRRGASRPRATACQLRCRSRRQVRMVSVYVPHGREVGHWHYEYKLAFLDALARQASGLVGAGRSRRDLWRHQRRADQQRHLPSRRVRRADSRHPCRARRPGAGPRSGARRRRCCPLGTSTNGASRGGTTV